MKHTLLSVGSVGSVNNLSSSSFLHAKWNNLVTKNIHTKRHHYHYHNQQLIKCVCKEDHKHEISDKCQRVEEFCYLHKDTDTCKQYDELLNRVCHDLDTNTEYQDILNHHDFYKFEHNKMMKVFSKLHILHDYYGQQHDNDKHESVEMFNEYYNDFYNRLLQLFE